MTDSHAAPPREGEFPASGSVPPPDHVRATFGLDRADVVPRPGGGWRIGEVVMTLVPDHARAAWSAAVREELVVDGIRVARPVRATDGRYVVAGWRADTYIAGTPESRHDELVQLSWRLHEATAPLERPRFILQTPAPPHSEVDIFTVADRAAWEDQPLKTARLAGLSEPTDREGAHSVDVLRQLASLRRPVSSPNQVVHGDLFGTVLFAGAAAPGLTDITPYWRPAGWAAAVVVVDSIAWGGADEGLIGRWADTPEWPQMLLRATMFRLAVHAVHPRATAEALPGLLRVAELVRFLV